MSNYYNQIAHIYDATRPLPQIVSEQIADCILKIVAVTPETTFLEPGIGTGRTSLAIIRRGYSYTGIDISEEMMDQLRHKLAGVPHNLNLIQADASSLPFKNASFDVVLTTHVLHCLPDWLQGLAEIRRVLKPNGFYLACENLLTPHQREFENHFRAILASYQPEIQPTQEKKLSAFKDGIAQVLSEQGVAVETFTAAQWQVEQTVADLLNIYQSKAIALCWTIPHDVFDRVMQDFQAWCQIHYKLEDILSSEATFDITVVRN